MKIFLALTLLLSILLVPQSLDPFDQPENPSPRLIEFRTQNGASVNGVPSQQQFLPHLVLKRNGTLTPESERTFLLDLSGLSFPADAVMLSLLIETQHGDPDLGGGEQNRIRVFEHAIELSSGHLPQDLQPLSIRFNEFTGSGDLQIPTPTDYFRTQLIAFDRYGADVYSQATDYAFLMENQWEALLPSLKEQVTGAAPRKILVYYSDMFPFELDRQTGDGRLDRSSVEGYIQHELVPEMINAIVVQTNLWDFPWYSEWTGYRQEEGPKTLSVALTAYETWFHGHAPYPYQGNAAVSVRIDGGMEEYASLTDGIMNTFQHELFHNQQRNISQHFGGHGDVDGVQDAWELISEGSAVLASSVAQPAVQFEHNRGWRSYMTRARAFLGGAAEGDLNRSYSEVGSHSAIYWRFLYERCDGMVDGSENPAAGMQVIRRLLELTYQAQVVDINLSPAVVESFPALMDLLLAQSPACGFEDYRQSLEAFSVAVYKLGLNQGRCTQPGLPVGCSLYDPFSVYPSPQVLSTGLFSEAEILSGDIPSSYGMDFIDISLDTGRNAGPLVLDLVQASGFGARYSIWVLPVYQNGELGPAVRFTEDGNGRYAIQLDPEQLQDISRLGLIVSRLDANEATVSGAYQLSIQRQPG